MSTQVLNDLQKSVTPALAALTKVQFDAGRAAQLAFASVDWQRTFNVVADQRLQTLAPLIEAQAAALSRSKDLQLVSESVVAAFSKLTINIPTIDVAYLAGLRLEVTRSIEATPQAAQAELGEVLEVAAQVEAQAEAGRAGDRGNRNVIVTVGLIIMFLADQDKVVAHAAKDASLVGDALWHLLNYLDALLLFLFRQPPPRM